MRLETGRILETDRRLETDKFSVLKFSRLLLRIFEKR